VEELPPHHADPFDRMIISQAIAEDLRVVTGDRQLGLYDIRLIPC
jgi:PIN domain nuclease of toxin-antitoxin system